MINPTPLLPTPVAAQTMLAALPSATILTPARPSPGIETFQRPARKPPPGLSLSSLIFIPSRRYRYCIPEYCFSAAFNLAITIVFYYCTALAKYEIFVEPHQFVKNLKLPLVEMNLSHKYRDFFVQNLRF